jgi:hypothetical protein
LSHTSAGALFAVDSGNERTVINAFERDISLFHTLMPHFLVVEAQ